MTLSNKLTIIILFALLFLSSLFFLPQLQILGPQTMNYVFIISTLLLILGKIVSGNIFHFLAGNKAAGILLLLILVICLNSVWVLSPAIIFSPLTFVINNAQVLIETLKYLCAIAFAFIFLDQLKSHKWQTITSIFLFFILFIFSCITIYQILISQANILPWAYGVRIAQKVTVSQPIMGTGIGLFNKAYELYRPLDTKNDTGLSSYYASSSSFTLDLLTSVGVLAFLLYYLLFVLALYNSTINKNYTLLIIVILGFSASVFIPFTVIMIACYFSLLLISSFNPKTLRDDNQLDLITKILSSIIVCLLLVISFKLFISAYYYQKFQKEHDPNSAYQSLQKAIDIYPNVYYYHTDLAKVSLSLADLMAKKDSPSNNDKILMAKLIPQAINEAKIAIKLSPSSSLTYETAGLIYKNLIGVVPQADQYSLAYLKEAIARNPVNSSLQSQIASVYFLNSDYDQAEKFYQNSLSLNPKFYPALYGLAQVKKALDKTGEYLVLLKQALTVTPFVSPDYVKIKKEIAGAEIDTSNN